MSDGDWQDFGDFNQPSKGSSLNIGPVFCGEVFRNDAEEGFPWRSSLNGYPVARHTTMKEGQERIEWEVCNRVRLMSPAYRALKARRS